MTPAVQQLKKQAVDFKLHRYKHDANESNYGKEAVEKLKVNINQVFKTLVIQTEDNKLAVAIIPVNQQLNLKAAAKALNSKKVQMASAQQVEKSTGYVLGGVSPIGQKKTLVTLLDNRALNFTTLFISGGKRGLEIEMAPQDLLKVTQAEIVSLA